MPYMNANNSTKLSVKTWLVLVFAFSSGFIIMAIELLGASVSIKVGDETAVPALPLVYRFTSYFWDV